MPGWATSLSEEELSWERIGQNRATGGGNVTVNLPAGVQDGDLLVGIQMFQSNNPAPSVTAGWASQYLSTLVAPTFRISTRIAHGEGASVTFVGNTTEAMVIAYRRATGILTVGGLQRVTPGSNLSAPSINANGGSVLALFVKNNQTPTTSGPAGTTKIITEVSAFGALFALNTPVFGATGALQATWSSGGANIAAIQFEVK